MRRDRCTWAVSLALTAAMVCVTTAVVAGGILAQLDWRVHEWADARPDSAVRAFAYGVALIGGRWVLLWPLGIAAVWLAWRERHWWPAGYAALGVLGMIGAVGAGKLAIGRTAPAERMDAVFAGGMSFPSGHTVNVIVLGWMLVRILAWLLARRQRRALVAGGGSVAAVTALMSWSMIYLDYHWVSDMLASWLLGPLILVVLDRILLPVIGRAGAGRREVLAVRS